jgi:hypothetical protein
MIKLILIKESDLDYGLIPIILCAWTNRFDELT